MNGYERRKLKKIEQIYKVSSQLFFKYGFQKVNVNEIAEMANVSPATIYNYFGTKEQLYIDMLTHWMDKQVEIYEDILDSGLPFPEKTKKIMLLEAENVNFLLDEFTNAPSSEVSGLEQVMESYTKHKIEPFFMRFVELGKQEGYIHRDQTEEMTMRYFTMFKNELRRYWETTGEEPITRNVEQLLELFFYGLVGQAR